MVLGIISGVIVIAVCIVGYNMQQKQIAEKKANGTYKEKPIKSVYKMDPEKVKKLNTLDK